MVEFLNPRKRRRDDLSCELASLTKRFRDLNLDVHEGRCSSINGIYNFPTNCNHIDATIPIECPAAAYSDYNPELGMQQNPFYYEKNRVLYVLHAERVRRHCHCAVHTGWGRILTDDFHTAVELQTNRYKVRKLW